ncbi:MAG TPA: hypothetical protein VFW11_19020 [Cyclobacteriaceae bacterium]|nr:hypothetical protein [Cyclobacteriaceae bacterium]
MRELFQSTMGKEKRSKIDSLRRLELQDDRAVYVITCGIKGCVCGREDIECGRGFFSLFIQAAYGIQFSHRASVPYHVDYGNLNYRYSDSKRADSNFWNYYFNQPIKSIDNDLKPVINRFIELYPLKIWSRQHFREVNKEVIRHLEFTKNLKLRVEEAIDRLKGKTVLGVHIRLTDHADEISPVKFEKYLSMIDKHIYHYDLLFVATDDQHALKELQNKYGQKVIYNDATRSEDNQPVHLNDAIEHRATLGFEVFIDCYCLSLCKKVILNHSNVSYSALLFNPELPYILMERVKPKIKRLKTLLLYYLNHWGIRKW